MRRSTLTLVLAAAFSMQCRFPDDDLLHSYCEIPLENLTCPARPLEDYLPGDSRESAEDCELWLEGPLVGAEIPARILVPDTLFRVIERSDEGTDWSCSDESGEFAVQVDDRMRASYSTATLVCPSRRDSCPSLDESPSRSCSRRNIAFELEGAVAMSDVVPTDAGPALVWHSGTTTDSEPRVTWLTVGDDGEITGETVAPCGTGECPWIPARFAERIPAQQAVARGDSILAPGLCGDDWITEVTPTGECRLHRATESMTGSSTRRPLSISRNADDHIVVTWTDGARLLVDTLVDRDGSLEPIASDVVLWAPPEFHSHNPRAFCIDGDDGSPLCLRTWAISLMDILSWPLDVEEQRSGLTGELVWQHTGTNETFPQSGSIGRGQGLRIVPARGPFEADATGVVAWRDPDAGMFLNAWRLSPSMGGFARFGRDRVQIDAGQTTTGTDWTVSEPTVAPVDERRFVVGWWHQPVTGAVELGLTLVTVSDQLELETSTIVLEGLEEAITGVLEELPLIAWLPGEDSSSWENGRLFVGWTAGFGQQEFEYLVAAPAASEPVSSPELTRFVVQTTDIIELPTPCDPACAAGAVALDGDFIAVIASSYGMVVERIAAEGGSRARDLFDVSAVAAPVSLEIMPTAGPRESGQLWITTGSTHLEGDSEDLSASLVAFVGAAVVDVRAEGLVELANVPRIAPGELDGTLGLQPSFTGLGAQIIWSELAPPPLLEFFPEDGSDSLSTDPSYMESRTRTRVIELTRDWASFDFEEVAMPRAGMLEDPPTMAITSDIQCPDIPPTDGDARCVFASVSTLDRREIDVLGADDGVEHFSYGETVMVENAASGFPFWLSPGYDGGMNSDLLVPTSIFVSEGATTSVFMGLAPYYPSSVDLVVERYRQHDGLTDEVSPDTAWLRELGALFQEPMDASALHFATPLEQSSTRRGLVWTRSVAFNSEIAFYSDGLLPVWPSVEDIDYDTRVVEVLFTEVDDRLHPRARATTLDWRGELAPSHWLAATDAMSYYPTFVDSDVVSRFQNSAALEIEEGRYVVSWIRHDVDWVLDTNMDASGDEIFIPSVAGAGFVQQVVCE